MREDQSMETERACPDTLTQRPSCIQRGASRPRLSFSALRFITLAVFTAPVHADFIFPDFSDTSELNLVGSAAQVGQRLRLAPDSGDQAGAAWFVTKQSVEGGF